LLRLHVQGLHVADEYCRQLQRGLQHLKQSVIVYSMNHFQIVSILSKKRPRPESSETAAGGGM
jgi:hypothetical protein